MSRYPESDKQQAAMNAGSHIIGEFLDWLLNEQGIVLCTWHRHTDDCLCSDDWHNDGVDRQSPPDKCPSCTSHRQAVRHHTCGKVEQHPVPAVHRSIVSWLALYFGIDEDKLEAEKRAILEEIYANASNATQEAARAAEETT